MQRMKLLLAGSVLMVILSACSLLPEVNSTENSAGPNPAQPTATVDITQDPDGVANTFLNQWENGNYEGMYSLLTPNSQREYALERFVEIYESTASTMMQISVDTTPLSALKSNPTTAQLSFRVVYSTAVLGDIEEEMTMNLIFSEEKNRWGVSWSPAMIFPELANGNTLTLEVEAPARANIYDRNGDWLVASNSTTWTLSIVPGEISTEFEDDMLNLLSRVLRTPPETIRNNYAGAPDDWLVAVGDTDAETLQEYYTQLSSWPGLSWGEKTGRRYFNLLAPHVLGYTAFIPEEQVDFYRAQGYRGDEIVGLSGLEAWGEEYLAGTRGGTLNAWTPGGEFFAEIASRNPEPAQSLYTTIDRNLQAIVQDAIEEAYRVSESTWAPTAGGAAVVVLDVNTGDVLAMASYPYFDPNVFNPNNNHPQLTEGYLNELGNNPLKPFLNRATQGVYPPGSVFKLATATAALGSGVYDASDTWNCTGIWTGLGTDPGSIRYDWLEGGHGTVDLSQAITGSCNTYFYEVGLRTGQIDFNIIPEFAREYGLGQELGIQIAEQAGQVPDPDWLWENRGEEWTVADSVNIAIGQGALQVTPLQIATMVSAIANGGTVYQPQLVDYIALIGEEPSVTFDPVVLNQVSLTPDQIQTIRDGMRDVTSDPTLGTAYWRLGSMGIATAGKTGTAQVSAEGAPPLAWFAGYAPYEEPEIAVVIMVENGGQGSGVAAPIFRRIIERYYDLRVAPYPDDWFDPDLFDFVSDEIGE